ncbi:glycosyltransferase 87 family protein [Pseudomonas sp. Hp2]|uniref:glycosyltransferase 87 family protein n=1 Tax=Pseudomonas sp. Hp2 TaxID=701189 RepID=UPI001C498756|nr:glycosyltransferase 87 family protein [Pseudomonas sp. Hp2]
MSAPGAHSTSIEGMRSRAWIARLLRALDRRFAFRSRANVAAAVGAVALIGGVASLLLGQDANWDLRNYHRYNGYAWLHDRLEQDLAPAQMQTYFGPLLDALHYLLSSLCPAPLAGFLVGALHALAFAPLAAIAWQLLRLHPQRERLVPLLALAGLCTGAFLSELGGSMADNTTALPVLAALALVLHAQQRRPAAGPARGAWLLAGTLLGVAVSLKLTNAIYALGLAAAGLAGGEGWSRRFGGVAAMAASALLVFAVLAGPWYWRLWETFGNPLLPQFNGIFQAPMAQPVSVADTRWLPRGVLEWLVWPLLFTFNPWRVSEIALFQSIWAVLYGLALVRLAYWLVRRRVAPSVRFDALLPLLAFFGVAYLAWQALFSIQRYLVVLELLAPLLAWIGCQYVFPARRARLVAACLVGACALVSLGGWNDWGHEPWSREGFAVQAPAMAEPGRSAVLLVGDEPQSWRIPSLPADAAYLSVASNFPESAAYAERVAALLARRPRHYAMLRAEVDRKALRVERMNAWAARLGLADQDDCRALRWLVEHGMRARLDDSQAGACRLVPRPGTTRDIAAEDKAIQAASGQKLARYGLALDVASCRRMSSWIGQTEYPYQWCRVTPAAR